MFRWVFFLIILLLITTVAVLSVVYSGFASVLKVIFAVLAFLFIRSFIRKSVLRKEITTHFIINDY